MIQLEQKEGRQDAEQATGMPVQRSDEIGQPEMSFEMPPDLQRDHEVMQIHQRRKVVFIQDFVDSKEIGL